jgi:hypothetical protein
MVKAISVAPKSKQMTFKSNALKSTIGSKPKVHLHRIKGSEEAKAHMKNVRMHLFNPKTSSKVKNTVSATKLSNTVGKDIRPRKVDPSPTAE